MIRTFKDAEAEELSKGIVSARLESCERVARRKMGYLAAAQRLSDLAVPPGNKLEALHGDREGQHSIRINRKWRICFVWNDDGVRQVEVTDYHS